MKGEGCQLMREIEKSLLEREKEKGERVVAFKSMQLCNTKGRMVSE